MTPKFQSYKLNFGPQHPSAHGVLRLILSLSGETVFQAEPHIGLLHRGTEKLLEHKTYLQGLPYFDRLDYVSMMTQEHAFCLSIEKSLKLQVPKRAQIIRTLFDEITRILNHLMSITTHALDLGALSPFLWAFEEREKLMEFYERVSGARMHAAYYRPGGVSFELPYGLVNDIVHFAKQFVSRVNEIELFLVTNRIWLQRLVGVGLVEVKDCENFSFSGVLLRGSGIRWDIRKACSYEIYDNLKFKTPVSENGDSFDRFLIRVEEMRQSCSLITQCAHLLETPGPVRTINDKIGISSKSLIDNSMESLINFFKYFSSGFFNPKSSIYSSIEAPKGEFGVMISADNSGIPYRCKIRSPGYFHLQGIKKLATGALISDVVTLIGTLDIVFGEIDR